MLHFSFIGYSISFASVSNVMLSLLEPNASKNHQGIEVGVASFNTITTQRLFDSYSHNFEFCRFEGLKGMPPPRDTTMIPLNWKFENTAWPCWVPCAAVSTSKEKGHLLTERLILITKGSYVATTQWGSKGNVRGTPVFFQVPPGIFICNSKSFWKTITTKKSLTIKDSDI